MPVPGRNHVVERFGHGGVGSHTAHKVYGLLKSSFFQRSHHSSHAFAKCVEHGVQRDALLLEVNEVGLGKDAAPGSYPGGSAFKLKRQTGEVLHADANPVCLLLQESSCACGTKWIRCYLPRLLQAIFKLYH